MEIKANNADIVQQINVIIRLYSPSNKADPFPGANKKFELLLLNQNFVQKPDDPLRGVWDPSRNRAKREGPNIDVYALVK